MSRTAILISCSEEEATKIRTRAEYDFRGVSAYVLSIVLRAVELDEKLLGQFHKLTPLPARTPVLGRRTAVLVRCSDDQASRIRADLTADVHGVLVRETLDHRYTCRDRDVKPDVGT